MCLRVRQSSLFSTLWTLACQALLSIGFSRQEYWSGLLCVGREQISQEACSGSLTPRFVNNDYVKAELTDSTAHARQEALAWSRVTLCSTHMWALSKNGSITVASWLCWWGQPWEERIQCVLGYGCCAKQERGCVVLGYAMAADTAAALVKRK